MPMYKLPVSSSTSLSDDDNDDEVEQKTTFFSEASRQTFAVAVAPAQWSSKMRPNAKLSTRRSPISKLPQELLIHILKHLHSNRDIVNSLRVSRTWCECSVELLWHKPAFPRYETVHKMARLLARPSHTFTYSRFIRRLNFQGLAGALQDDIFSVFACCVRLERLTMVNCDHISADALTRVLPFYPNLIALDLSGVSNVTDEAIIAFALEARRLQGINLTGCIKISDKAVMTLAQNCPLLRRVKMSGVVDLTDKPVTALAELCPLLLEIDLHNCGLITDISVRDLWSHSYLMREMRLSHCSKLTDLAFPRPPRSEGNNQPDLPTAFPVNPNDSAVDLPPLILSRPLDHLRMLDLTACSLITDDAVEGIISFAPKIRNLVLSKCGLVTDRSVDNICRLGRHLHYLHLGHAAKITDKSVRALARSCTRLRYVDFASKSNPCFGVYRLSYRIERLCALDRYVCV